MTARVEAHVELRKYYALKVAQHMLHGHDSQKLTTTACMLSTLHKHNSLSPAAQGNASTPRCFGIDLLSSSNKAIDSTTHLQEDMHETWQLGPG